jgi:hypothetical protein
VFVQYRVYWGAGQGGGGGIRVNYQPPTHLLRSSAPEKVNRLKELQATTAELHVLLPAFPSSPSAYSAYSAVYHPDQHPSSHHQALVRSSNRIRVVRRLRRLRRFRERGSCAHQTSRICGICEICGRVGRGEAGRWTAEYAEYAETVRHGCFLPRWPVGLGGVTGALEGIGGFLSPPSGLMGGCGVCTTRGLRPLATYLCPLGKEGRGYKLSEAKPAVAGRSGRGIAVEDRSGSRLSSTLLGPRQAASTKPIAATSRSYSAGDERPLFSRVYGESESVGQKGA